MTILALTVASWTALSVVTALAFGAVAGALKRSEPALDVSLLAGAGAARTSRDAAPVPGVSLPAQRRATAPVLSS